MPWQRPTDRKTLHACIAPTRRMIHSRSVLDAGTMKKVHSMFAALVAGLFLLPSALFAGFENCGIQYQKLNWAGRQVDKFTTVIAPVKSGEVAVFDRAQLRCNGNNVSDELSIHISRSGSTEIERLDASLKRHGFKFESEYSGSRIAFPPNWNSDGQGRHDAIACLSMKNEFFLDQLGHQTFCGASDVVIAFELLSSRRNESDACSIVAKFHSQNAYVWILASQVEQTACNKMTKHAFFFHVTDTLRLFRFLDARYGAETL